MGEVQEIKMVFLTSENINGEERSENGTPLSEN